MKSALAQIGVGLTYDNISFITDSSVLDKLIWGNPAFVNFKILQQNLHSKKLFRRCCLLVSRVSLMPQAQNE